MRALGNTGVRCATIIVTIMVAFAGPAAARITKTKPSPSARWNPGLPLVIGGGFEFQSDQEQSQYDFPLLLEYSFSEQLNLTIEPNFSKIESKSEDVRSVGGFGDLETSMQWEFVSERRYRPALTLEGLIKWPTATDPDLGTRRHDYGVGLLLSKDLAVLDLDLGLLYTVVGGSQEQNTMEIALASEVPVVNHLFSVIAEVVHTIGTGAFQPVTDRTEGTLGFSWHVNRYLKLEVGYKLADDLRGQVVTAWEWNFEGDD